MYRPHLILIFMMGFNFGGSATLPNIPNPTHIQTLAGRYERTGVVDRTVEAQFKGLGPVLPRPVFIDGLLPFAPQKWTGQDEDFFFQRFNPSDYVLILVKEDKRLVLGTIGNLTELNDGTLLLRRRGTLAGEGNIPADADGEIRLSKEERDGVRWLVVDTRVEWTKRSLFRSKKMEYRSLVRFREIAVSP